MTMGMWNDENGEKCLTKNTGATTFPPQFGGAAKGKRLNGQARRLTSPHLEVLCRTSTGDYKAPLCCERLMKGMLLGVLFFPRLRGKSGAAG